MLSVVVTEDPRQMLPVQPSGILAHDIYVRVTCLPQWWVVFYFSLSNDMRVNLYTMQHELQCGYMIYTLTELKKKSFPTLQDNFKNVV